MDSIAFDRRHGGIPADHGLIDFSVNLNPFGPPPAVLDAYHRAAAGIGKYPEPFAATLTGAIADHLGIAAENVLAGNGSTQLFYLIARVLRPRRPLVVIPTFSEIANSLITMSSAPSPIRLRREHGYQFDVDEIVAALNRGADALFLGRPNSPTGSSLDLAALSTIARRCAQSRCCLVIDEAFIEFSDDPSSALNLIEQHDCVIVLRSMTKLYAIPGLRLGYLLAAQRIVAELARALEPWSVSGPAAAVGLACLAQPESWRNQIQDRLRRERAYLVQEMGKLAVEVFPSTANFLMFAIAAGARPFAQHMREEGIAVRDLAELPGAGPGLYRIAVRSRQENNRLLQAVRTYK